MSATSEQRTPEEIADNLSRKRVDLILAFDGHEKLNTKNLRLATGYDNNTVNYHMKRANTSLLNSGLATRVGIDEDANTSGSQPAEWKLTDTGQDVLDVFRQREIDDSVDISKFDEIRDEVERGRKEREKLRSDHKELEQRFEALKERLTGDYWQSIISAIESRTHD